MNLFRLSAFCVAAAALVACKPDEDGEPFTPNPTAGLRYVNVVGDTGALDFRVVDVVTNATQTGATFRTGGAVGGVTTAFMPPHTPIPAGTRRIRVFLSSSDPAVASTILLDTSYTFEANRDYTFYVYGYARTGSTPGMTALITQDGDVAFPANNTNKIAVRVINLIPPTAGAPSPTAAVDAWVITSTQAPPYPGTATFPGVGFLSVTPYSQIDTSASTGWRVAVTAASTNTPAVIGPVSMPVGIRGTSTVNPIAGAYVAGSAISAVLVPHGVAGSPAGSFTTPSILYLIDRHPPLTAP
ncbi:MAG TPA: DUF4397 domain-containing protein [Gemmatimonadales bacterium]|nr:DUF4397 domain-containing protein [Gemmatimonadales bacterium]